MPIHYISYKQIDKIKWDNCIDNADNGLIYAYSHYLDAMAENWDAVVLDDYTAVMPLTWKKKYGILYLYQPYFTANLGLFGNNLNGVLLNEFLQKIPSKFRYWDISLNSHNVFETKHYQLHLRMNLILSLNNSYENISNKFSENIRRNTKKAIQLNCSVIKDFSVSEVIKISQQQVEKFSRVPASAFTNFARLYELLHKKGNAITYGVVDSANQLLASAVFIFSHNRAYYIMVGNHPNSKVYGASHLLLSSFIQDHAGKELTLDFEGSDIKSLAFFYRSFGAREEFYPALKNNKLPRLLRLFKK